MANKAKFTDKRHSAEAEAEVEPVAVEEAPEVAEASEVAEEGGYYERYLRVTADLENYKRRKAQEMMDSARYSSEAAALALLPVLDNLERSLEHVPESEDAQGFVEGVRIAVREFVARLEQIGVTPISAVGQKFDPAVHEAIGEEASELPTETVSSEIQRGWMLHDRVLRPAVVRIAAPPAGK